MVFLLVTWLRGLLLVGRARRALHAASATVPHFVPGPAAAGTAGAAAPCRNRREKSLARNSACGREGSKVSLEFLEKSALLERLRVGCGTLWGCCNLLHVAWPSHVQGKWDLHRLLCPLSLLCQYEGELRDSEQEKAGAACCPEAF